MTICSDGTEPGSPAIRIAIESDQLRDRSLHRTLLGAP